MPVIFAWTAVSGCLGYYKHQMERNNIHTYHSFIFEILVELDSEVDTFVSVDVVNSHANLTHFISSVFYALPLKRLTDKNVAQFRLCILPPCQK